MFFLLFLIFFFFFFFVLQVHFTKTQFDSWTSYSCFSRICLEQIYGEKQPASEESSPNISEDGSSDQSRDESNIFEKVTAKKPRNIIDLSEELSIFSAVSNVDLENLNLSIITNIKDLLNTAFLASQRDRFSKPSRRTQNQVFNKWSFWYYLW